MSNGSFRAVVVVALVLVLLGGGLASAPEAAAQPSIAEAACQFPGLGAACTAIGAIGDATRAVAGAGVDAILDGIRDAIASGLGWFLERLLGAITGTTSPSLDGVVAEHAALMGQAGALFVLPFVILAIAQALLNGNPAGVVRVLGLYVPAAALLTGLVMVATAGLLQITDAISRRSASGLVTDLQRFQAGIPDALSAPQVPVLMAILIGGLMLAAGLLLWIELIILAAAIKLVVVFMPLFFAGLVWPATQPWAKRLLDVLGALIIAKPVMIETLALGVAEFTSGNGIESVLTGAAMFVLAVISPLVVLSLFPLAIEAAHVGRGRMGATWQGTPGAARSGGRMAWSAASARISGAGPVRVRPPSAPVRPGNPRIPMGGAR